MNDASPWAALAEALRASAPFRALAAGRGAASGLPLPAAAWVADLLSRDLGRPLLVLVPHESQALAWLEAAGLFGTEGVYFPAPSLTPYQEASVSLQVRAQESAVLDAVTSGATRLVVATPRALFRRLPPPSAYRDAVLELRPGDELPLGPLAERLVRHGFRRADLVSEVGDFAVRGGVFDVFPPGAEAPLRLELFGDTLESLRTFDVADQRSTGRQDSARVLPLSPFPQGPSERRRLAERLASELGRGLGMDAARALDELRGGGEFPGWEHHLPLLAVETPSLADLVAEPLVVTLAPDTLVAEARRHQELLADDFELRRDQGRPVLPPETLEHGLDSVLARLGSADLVVDELAAGHGGADFHGTTTDLFHGQLPRFPREVETARARGERLVVVSPPEHLRRLEDMARSYELPLGRGGMELVPGELARGFRLPAAGVVVFGEAQIFPRLPAARPRRRGAHEAFVSGLRDLRVGDYVVHADHGIGQFVGLRVVAGDGGEAAGLPPELRGAAPPAEGDTEVMEVAYRDGRRLLMPLSRLDLLQRYSGLEGVAPRLDQLGGGSWNRTKERVRSGMRRLATDLLRLYAERQLSVAPAMPPDSDLMRAMEAAFEFEETVDQLEAIEAVQRDLEGTRPMDRLLVGDVGFGKTEVAMRAAFKVVEGGYQVAVLAPTTILADQHFDTFSRRLSGLPVKVEMISRFRSPAEVRAIRGRLASGGIDILIGTHRLLSQDIEMPRLGLLIVDEEQRFGVGQKERLKELKKSVHVLAMSATPVPRTLQLSLAGVRDLSVIESPPRDRMAVETAILPWSRELVREAIEFEVERQGQVYYVVHRVEGIEKVAAELRAALPGLRITVGHGQLDEQELARRMHAFKRGEHDLLLATTIIENGIDISNVNTMIVHRADRFGLAQLYQLRGRVGRSHQLAYCYLLVPPDRSLSETARKRLAAVREFSELGAGFRVAARDLEIRGAGNLLGPEQSGQIAAVGIETYLEMMRQTVAELKGEAPVEVPSTQLDLPVRFAIPQEYVGDANLRMELYRRIASSDDGPALLAELEDRFGAAPPAVRELLEVAALKRLAESLRVQSIAGQGDRLQIRWRRDTPVEADRLIRWVAAAPRARFSPAGVLTLDGVAVSRMVSTARRTLEELAG